MTIQTFPQKRGLKGVKARNEERPQKEFYKVNRHDSWKGSEEVCRVESVKYAGIQA